MLEDFKIESVGTSSPSTKGKFIVSAMYLATVLFPQPAGPVMSQIWRIFCGWVED